MQNKTVLTGNLTRFLGALSNLTAACASRQEGMGLLWGNPGEGKSTTIAFARNQRDGVHVRARVTWSVTSMLAALCEELDLAPQQRRNAMLDAVAGKLVMYPRPLFIDEADYLFRQTDMLDALRDLYDLARVPVVLIGMEDMPRKVRSDRARFSRFERRITEWVEFKGVTLEDARKTAQELCEVAVEDALIERVHRENSGNMGHMVRGLANIERFGKTNGLGLVTLADYGNRDVRGGAAV